MAIDTITHTGGTSWRFQISGTPPFKWYLDGKLIPSADDDENGATTVTDRIIDGTDSEEPPPVEVQDSTESNPQTLEYSNRLIMQWRRSGAFDYVVRQQEADLSFTTKETILDAGGRGYFQHETEPLDEGTETFRLVARDDRGNESTPLDYDMLVVRNPAVPSISASYDPVTGDLTISARG